MLSDANLPWWHMDSPHPLAWWHLHQSEMEGSLSLVNFSLHFLVRCHRLPTERLYRLLMTTATLLMLDTLVLRYWCWMKMLSVEAAIRCITVWIMVSSLSYLGWIRVARLAGRWSLGLRLPSFFVCLCWLYSPSTRDRHELWVVSNHSDALTAYYNHHDVDDASVWEATSHLTHYFVLKNVTLTPRKPGDCQCLCRNSMNTTMRAISIVSWPRTTLCESREHCRCRWSELGKTIATAMILCMVLQ